jgi:phosphatidylethanolamine N-methyltransferase
MIYFRWTSGTFELRYHHDGRYNVLALSLPFEITIPPFFPNTTTTTTTTTTSSEELNEEITFEHSATRQLVESALLPVVQNCFDRDPDVAPRTVDEHFGPTLEREGKYAKRVVYAVSRMFGIDFAPEVVQADGTVRNLSWRICNAKKVLAPYSSMSKGRSTPT